MPVPRAVRLAAWGNAVLSGATSVDDAIDQITATDARHRVSGLPQEPDEVGLPLAFGRLRALRVDGLRLALPVPGDVSALPGPPAFNAEAVEAGECVLALGDVPLGLVPEVNMADGSAYVVWRAYETAPPRVASPTLQETERELAETLREVTQDLVRLDVARWDPEVAARLAALRAEGRGEPVLAPHYPARAHRVLAQASRLQQIAVLAEESPGGAVSAGAMANRSAVLARLSPVTRRAIVAAANSVLDPAARGE
jgi:hypothetical protein